jgi:LysM repeat protein
MGSTAMFRILPPGNTIQMVTIEGSIALDQGTPNQVVVSGGFSTVRCLDGAKNLGIDAVPNDQEVIPGCPWTAPIPGTQQEYEIAQVVLGAFAALNGQLCPNGGQNIIHTVKSGQNLFRIAQAYGTTVAAIVKENNITNAQSIYNGQQLKISCALNTGRSPFAPALPVNPGPATGPFIPPGFPSGPPSLPSGPLSSMPSVPFSVTPGP